MKPPASLIVFGILNIVFGVTGIFGIIFSYAMMHSPLIETNPALKIMQQQPGYVAWTNIALPLGFVATLVNIVSGIGLLKARNWARKLAIGYAIFAIVSGLVSMGVNYIFLVGPMLAHAREAQGPEAAGAIGGVIGGMMGGCLGIIYPIVLLIFMTRPKVVAACSQPKIDR
jgi:hypothetical protein